MLERGTYIKTQHERVMKQKYKRKQEKTDRAKGKRTKGMGKEKNGGKARMICGEKIFYYHFCGHLSMR